MKIDDRITGLALVVFGAAVAWMASGFPMMAGLPYGPGFFPTIAAVGLIVCGIVVAVSGALAARAAAAGGPVPLRPTPREAMVGGLVRPFLILLVVVAFGLLLEPLGFHIAAVITVGAAALIFGAHPVTALVLAVAAAFATHVVFYSFLRVPLPWGVLTPVAW
jgi:putative tricarboxylic transport membrane protein